MSILKTGLIGCGSFARGMHVRNLKKNAKYAIHAVADINAEAANTLGAEVNAAYATTDINKILADKDLDVVFITTRHDSHAELSIRAAEAGKHILCEKPMGLDRDECRAVVAAVKKAGVKYTVGYNRGLAPLITRARDLLKTVPAKKLIYHRIQAPFPENSWTHDPKVGGGRFVGEGCHIFDLLCELVQAPPVAIHAVGGIFLNPDKVKIPDSGIITITFADGSVGTTLIASAGCSAFPKEATEIYCAGKAIYINDFREMSYFGFENQERARLEYAVVDKGQAIEIDQLADAILNDTEPPNGLIKAVRAAVISFMVNESIAGGRPVPISEADYKLKG